MTGKWRDERIAGLFWRAVSMPFNSGIASSMIAMAESVKTHCLIAMPISAAPMPNAVSGSVGHHRAGC